jgi:hypothetical protein
MRNGNTLLTTTALAAVERIKTLRLLTQKTGFQTTEEQFKILLKLDNADALAVADALRVGGAK